ncbi:MAG: RluA family pseudouridine synthase [Eubacteriales bacterium]|nr:RluA family pseudouridine synthase [Eubacteriales bacterium]
MRSKNEIIKIISDTANERLDSFLAAKIADCSRTYIQRLISEGHVLVNGEKAKSNLRLKKEDIVDIYIPEPVELKIEAEDISLQVVYEDDDLIIINKPKGMVVHPAAGNFSHTLVNALMSHCHETLSDINGIIRPGIVHRLDKDTSGLLVAAKNNKTHHSLSEQLKKHEIRRVYFALADGNISPDKGRIEAPLGRDRNDRKKMAVDITNGRHAVTHFTVIERFMRATLLRLELETGRTHQIRVHLAYIGHPVLGDEVYGRKTANKRLGIKTQALHAKKLGFAHPATGKHVMFETELPEYFNELADRLRKEK